MAKNTHLTFDERLSIQKLLSEQCSFKEIGQALGKDPTTISKEIKGHMLVIEKDSYNPCLHRKGCMHRGDICFPCKERYNKACSKCPSAQCFKKCSDFIEVHCKKS